jgi:predicted metalloprotease with PDZ domain
MSEPYCRRSVRWRRVRGVVSNLKADRIAVRLSSKRVALVAFQFIVPVCLVLSICHSGHSQALTARFSILSLAQPARVKIEGSYAQGSSAWSFRNSYGRITGLGDRIQSLSLTDQNGAGVAVRKVGSGEFKADRTATQFTYEISLGEPANAADAAHLSGLNDQYGYLMLADLLPMLRATSLRVEFQLPTAWRIASSAIASPRGWYDFTSADNAIFFLGRDLREKRRRVAASEFVFVTAGEWPFAGDAVTEIAAKIINDHRKHTGFEPNGRVVLMLAPFPGSFGSERWSAETRGSNVVLLLGRNSRPKPLLGQLSVVLCHELFHLWAPNALSLGGDYGWFFEGFTLYQALRCAVRLGFIDFQEYLDTLGRVYDSYLANGERDSLSLVEASRRRWTSGSSLVYDKGMLVAFLYDLKLREASKNRRSLDVVYQELFRRFVPTSKPVDGNESLASLMIEQDGDDQFTRRYIQGPGLIDLESALPHYGIRVGSSGNLKRLLVSETLSLEQRSLFASLGYRKK